MTPYRSCETCHDTGEIEVMTDRVFADRTIGWPKLIACPSCVAREDSEQQAILRAAANPLGHWRDDAQYRLALFYAVDTKDALIRAQAEHIEKLQAKLPPLRDRALSGRVRDG